MLRRGHDLYLNTTGNSYDLTIQEKSHDSRFFCVLRSLGITCNKPEDIVCML